MRAYTVISEHLNKMKQIIVLILISFLVGEARALEKTTLVGTWYSQNTDTLYVLFPSGSMLFTFLDPPENAPIENWHTMGTWRVVDGEFVEIKYTYKAEDKKPFLERTDKLKFFNGELLKEEGTGYSKIK